MYFCAIYHRHDIKQNTIRPLSWWHATIPGVLWYASRGCYGFHARALHMRVTMMEAKAM